MCFRRSMLVVLAGVVLTLGSTAVIAQEGAVEDQPICVETGEASWYGPGFEGNQTANGDVFDPDAMTAAHPTLPLESTVEVTNAETGETIEVEVNDRGPYVDDRIIDLSEGAAEELGVKEEGVAEVIVVAQPEDQSPEIREEIVETVEDKVQPAGEPPSC